jgi:DNA-binding SARP family transcriptional activator
VVSAESIAEALWDDDPPASARNTAQGYVKSLRRVLPPGRVITRAPGYLIELQADELDLDRFSRLCDRARLAAGRRDWAGATGQLTEALALWRGEPLADVRSAALQRTEAPRLRELRIQAVESRIDAEMHLGRHRQLIADLRQLTGHEPLREVLHGQLMLALYRNGRQAEALEVFRAVASRLRDELGISPGPELDQLHQLILRADPALTSVQAPAAGIAGPASAQAPPEDGECAMAEAAEPCLPQVSRQLPMTTAHFVGRAAELETLTALLSSAVVAAPVAAISGPPGVGKTTLALCWAHLAADQFPDGQLYVNLRGFDASAEPVPAAAAIRGFLDALQVPAERIPAGLPAQAALYRSLLAGRRVLVVLDNARDAGQVRPLLPGTAGCLTVVTSRNRLPGLIAAQGARPLMLTPLSRGEAAELMARCIGAKRVADAGEAADEVIESCARLPLAISVAAARAAIRPGVPLAALAAELRDVTTRLDVLDTRDGDSSMRTVCSWSSEQLSPAAARMFRLLGLHPGPGVSLPAAASMAGLTLPGARSALEELQLSSLLTEERPGRYWFHDLLRVYAAEQVLVHEKPADRRCAVGRLLDHYLISAHRCAVFVDPYWEPLDLPAVRRDVIPERIAGFADAMSWCETEFPVLMAAITAAGRHQFDVHAWQLSSCLAGFFSVRARPDQWRLPPCRRRAARTTTTGRRGPGTTWAARTRRWAATTTPGRTTQLRCAFTRHAAITWARPVCTSMSACRMSSGIGTTTSSARRQRSRPGSPARTTP